MICNTGLRCETLESLCQVDFSDKKFAIPIWELSANLQSEAVTKNLHLLSDDPFTNKAPHHLVNRYQGRHDRELLKQTPPLSKLLGKAGDLQSRSLSLKTQTRSSVQFSLAPERRAAVKKRNHVEENKNAQHIHRLNRRCARQCRQNPRVLNTSQP